MNAHTKLLIAALAALGAMSQYAQAEALPYKDIKLCKGVTLQNDSAKQWGCWTQFAPPAAGPSSAVGYLGQPGSEAYLPSLNPTQPTQPTQTSASSCAAGSMCGYALYLNQQGQIRVGDYAPAYLTLTPTTGATANGKTPFTVSFLLQQFNPVDNAPFITGAASWLQGMSGSYNNSTGSVSIAFKTNGVGKVNVNGVYDATNQFVEGTSPSSIAIQEYVSGNRITGYYVAGTPTSSGDLANQVINNVSASYSGTEFRSKAPVNIQVNFGQGNWTGSWGGSNAWQAAGTVSGGIIKSNSISGAYNAGQVQGTFYGANAQTIGGVSDVNNTVSGARHVDLFVVSKGGPL